MYLYEVYFYGLYIYNTNSKKIRALARAWTQKNRPLVELHARKNILSCIHVIHGNLTKSSSYREKFLRKVVQLSRKSPKTAPAIQIFRKNAKISRKPSKNQSKFWFFGAQLSKIFVFLPSSPQLAMYELLTLQKFGDFSRVNHDLSEM